MSAAVDDVTERKAHDAGHKRIIESKDSQCRNGGGILKKSLRSERI